MTFRKLTGKIHRWLGLTSGLVVFIIGITGCILAFRAEIEAVSKPWKFAQSDERPLVSPAQVESIVTKKLAGEKLAGLLSIQYPGPGRNVMAVYTTDRLHFSQAYLNPQTGAIIAWNVPTEDFFTFIEHGHRWLWFPWQIGRTIQSAFVLVFLMMMISGIILWWPKTFGRKNKKQAFGIYWKGKPKRVNYDLHNVLGFYMTWICLFIVITGLTISQPWFGKGIYWLISGGDPMPELVQPVSDTTQAQQPFRIARLNNIWQAHEQESNGLAELYYILPATKTAAVLEIINPMPLKTYQREFRYYDQFSLNNISPAGPYKGSYANAGFADKLLRMNIDIHMGVIGGIPTKLLVFITGLIAASLPVTGFYIWWGKRKKKSAPSKRR